MGCKDSNGTQSSIMSRFWMMALFEVGMGPSGCARVLVLNSQKERVQLQGVHDCIKRVTNCPA